MSLFAQNDPVTSRKASSTSTVKKGQLYPAKQFAELNSQMDEMPNTRLSAKDNSSDKKLFHVTKEQAMALMRANGKDNYATTRQRIITEGEQIETTNRKLQKIDN